jgi:hypothetical protein
MKLNELRCHFLAEVNAWWEWFLTTITDVDPTEFIAVENRSHNQLSLLQVPQYFLFLIRPAFVLADGWADT